jgi:uncharacterized protein
VPEQDRRNVRTGPLVRLAQRIMAQRAELGATTTRYRVTPGLTVPMRDGVTLVADHYAPLTDTPAGTLLMRGPYARDSLGARALMGIYAERGFHVLLQSTRGSFGSGGTFDPGVNETEDGVDTATWLREQPWFTGSFATVGASYLGFTEWALLADPPAELATSVIMMAPHHIGRAAWGRGTFALIDFLTWGYQVTWHEKGGWIRQLVRNALTPRRLQPVLNTLPLEQAASTVLGGSSPFYEPWLHNSDADGEYWRHRSASLEVVRTPVLLIGGWQDIFFDQTVEQYLTLRARGVDVALVIGPWTHGEGGTASVRESLDWLRGRRRDEPVRIFVTGDAGWRDLPDWPPAARETTLHPQPDGSLGDESATGTVTFVYDPTDPTPTIGGRLLAVSSAGYLDDSALALRDDVLTYTGPVLDADVEVIGVPRVEVVHAADTVSCDVMVRLCDVDAEGRSHNVSDGYTSLASGAAGPLRVDLDSMAHRFRAGHRIRLLVGGGSFPRFARNPGTGEPVATATELVSSTHTVDFDGFRLILPVS